MTRLLLLLIIGLPLTGCGASRNLYYLWDAERAVTGAEAIDAPTKAIYEYTLARQYLLKAREETGYSDYDDSEALARKAKDWAAKAIEVAQYGASERDLMIDDMDRQVPNDRAVEPPAAEPEE